MGREVERGGRGRRSQVNNGWRNYNKFHDKEEKKEVKSEIPAEDPYITVLVDKIWPLFSGTTIECRDTHTETGPD